MVLSAIAVYQNARNSGKPFDAIIMDLTIPGGMGGKEALQRFREIYPNVRAIVSSGFRDDPGNGQLQRIRVRRGLRKPYDANEVAEQLKSGPRRVTGEGSAH